MQLGGSCPGLPWLSYHASHGYLLCKTLQGTAPPQFYCLFHRKQPSIAPDRSKVRAVLADHDCGRIVRLSASRWELSRVIGSSTTHLVVVYAQLLL
jgi:hypothetical protein